MARQLISQFTLNSRVDRVQRNRVKGIGQYGYINPDGKPLPPEYLVRITSIRNRCEIICPIQEPLLLECDSRWEQFMPIPSVEAQLITQGISSALGNRRSLITRAMTRRIWMGSSPMRLRLHLKFQAVKDTTMEVAEPIRLLQSMMLPSDPSQDKDSKSTAELGSGALSSLSHYNFGEAGIQLAEAAKNLPFLIPPGPTPFTDPGFFRASTFSDKAKSADSWFGGDVIIVEWGTFLTFFNVIVSRATPKIPVMPDQNGKPIAAEIDMEFESYEMMTAESLKEVFTSGQWDKAKKELNNQGTIFNKINRENKDYQHP